MTALDSEKQSKNSKGILLEFIPKMIVGLTSAAIVPIVVLFLFVTLMSIFSVLLEQQAIRVSELLHNIGISFAVAFFVIAYVAPMIVVCLMLFGLPATLVGWRLGLIRWWTCVIVGFFLGSVPGGLFLLKTDSNTISSSANGVQYIVNGVRTLAGWIQFTEIVFLTGLLGALGGYSFWLVWRLFAHPNALKQSNS